MSHCVAISNQTVKYSEGVTRCCRSDELREKSCWHNKCRWLFLPIMQLKHRPVEWTRLHRSNRLSSLTQTSNNQRWDDNFPTTRRLTRTPYVYPECLGSVSLLLRRWASSVINHRCTPVETLHTDRFPVFLLELGTSGGNLLTGPSSCCETDREMGWS